MQVQVSIIRDIIYGSVGRGADFQAICKAAGMDPSGLSDAEKLISWEHSARAWAAAIELTGDELIGLHLGEKPRMTTFGMLGYLIQTCPTIGNAFQSIVKFNSALSTIFSYELMSDANHFHILCQPGALYLSNYPASARQAVELSLSSFVKTIQALSGKNIHPHSAHIAFTRRKQEEYERVLGCPVYFNSEHSCLTYPVEILDIPIISRDESLYIVFSGLLKEKMQVLNAHHSFSDKVKHHLLVDFKGQVPPVEIMASHLCMNTRTLQRKLSSEGISYRSICKDIRKELSISLIRHSGKNIGEVALLMGYSDATAFRRAFKSWTNIVPGSVKA